MPRSTPATRGDSVSLTIGPLVEIKVTLFSQKATDAGVARQQFTKDGHPVGVRPYDKLTGANVATEDIVKKIATEYGPVPLEDHEIEALFDLRPSSMTITCYQPAEMFGTVYVPKTPYTVEVTAEKVKSKRIAPPTQVQALKGLLKGMESLGVIALCEVVTRGKPKPAVLLPDGTLWFVYHEEELRGRRPEQPGEVSDEIVDMMAINFIEPKISDTPVTLTDHHSAAIQAYADQKGKEGNFESPEAPELVEAAASLGGSDDLMALLQASIKTASVA